MKRGPKPEPAAIKVAKGNPSKRRIGHEPVTAPIDGLISTVAAPSWLKSKALEQWRVLSPRLVQLKLLTAGHEITFGRYCVALARWLEAIETLEAEGEYYTVVSPHGTYKRPHPAANTADKLHRELLAHEAAFGLNPSDRQRIFAVRAGTGETGDLFGSAGATAQKPMYEQGPISPLGLLN